MAGLTKKEMVAAIWKKFKGIIGTKDISKIGDGTVTGAISELNSNSCANITAKSGISLNNLYTYCYKTGFSIEFQIFLTTDIPSSYSGVVATIPEEYAPSHQVWFPVFNSLGSNTVGRGTLNVNGEISIINQTSTKIQNAQGRCIYTLK